jgi:ABC-type uncharacterized transport system involved in gliding motility auxiliary subunit
VRAARARRVIWAVRVALAVDLFKIISSVVVPTLMVVFMLHFWFLKPKNRGDPAVPDNRLN